MIRSRTDLPRIEDPITVVTRLLVATYLIEAGLLLVLAPWTNIWERNYFAETVPWLGSVMANPFVKGGVTGIGVVTALAGMADFLGALFARRSPPAAGGPGAAGSPAL